MLFDLWREYLDSDRDAIAAAVNLPSSRIESSDHSVNAIRYALGEQQVVHLLNYAYDSTTDSIEPARDVRISIPWQHDQATCTLLAISGEERVTSRVESDQLIVDVPELDPYGVLVVEPAGR